MNMAIVRKHSVRTSEDAVHIHFKDQAVNAVREILRSRRNINRPHCEAKYSRGY